MKRRKYSDEFKEQILEEYRQVGNVALVARRHEISPKIKVFRKANTRIFFNLHRRKGVG